MLIFRCFSCQKTVMKFERHIYWLQMDFWCVFKSDS